MRTQEDQSKRTDQRGIEGLFQTERVAVLMKTSERHHQHFQAVRI
jgi:hypothetical protein